MNQNALYYKKDKFTYSHSAEHSLSYVFPFIPHTGRYINGQAHAFLQGHCPSHSTAWELKTKYIFITLYFVLFKKQINISYVHFENRRNSNANISLIRQTAKPVYFVAYIDIVIISITNTVTIIKHNGAMVHFITCLLSISIKYYCLRRHGY